MKKQPLYNVTEYYYDVVTDKTRLVSTVHYSKPYCIARMLKRLEDLKNKPGGTVHKLIKQKEYEKQ